MEILAARLRLLRDREGLSLEKFARKVDVSTKSISTWEKNQGDPELGSLIRLAKACQVSTDYLLGLTDEPAPSVASSVPVAPKSREGSAELLSAHYAGEAKPTPRTGRVRHSPRA